MQKSKKDKQIVHYKLKFKKYAKAKLIFLFGCLRF